MKKSKFILMDESNNEEENCILINREAELFEEKERLAREREFAEVMCDYREAELFEEMKKEKAK